MSEQIPLLTRVEGEGFLDLTVEGDRVVAARLKIIEPPRFFEQFLVGRDVREIPDLVARICGICPVAYQVTAAAAIEDALGVRISDWARRMRRLMYCGEWIESHSLYLHLLALPDVLGFSDAAAMGQRFPDEVRRGMDLFEVGNSIIRVLGGRSVHPVGLAVGGFHVAPRAADIAKLAGELQAALPQALELAGWACALSAEWSSGAPLDVTSVALRTGTGYPIEAGRIGVTPRAGGQGANGPEVKWYDTCAFEQHTIETHEEDSTALYSWLDGEPYLVGPVARLNLNADQLPPEVVEVMSQTDLHLPTMNLAHGLAARAVEVYLTLVEALQLCEDYIEPAPTEVAVDLDQVLAAKPGTGPRVGFAATEAPRGLLWLRFELDEAGAVRHCRIVPPTAQNQATVQEHLRRVVEALGTHLPEAELRHTCEAVIRYYDPCISCATHLVKVRVHWSEPMDDARDPREASPR